MPGTTPVYGITYPIDTDPLADGAAAIQDTAETVEAALQAAVAATLTEAEANAAYLPKASPAFTGTLSGPKIVQDALGSVLNALGVGSSLSGTTAAADSGKVRVQAGTAVVSTNASGDFTVTFPTAFPAGLLSVVASSGDVAIAATVAPASYSLSAFNGRALNSAGGAVASSTIRVNYIAIGG